jgi:hypothetical protein
VLVSRSGIAVLYLMRSVYFYENLITFSIVDLREGGGEGAGKEICSNILEKVSTTYTNAMAKT